MRRLELIVDPDGKLKIEALDFQGADCEIATRFLETALGQVTERRRKPEYLAKSKVKATQRVQR